MSNRAFEKSRERNLKNEIRILNDVIDRKILRGVSYVREARRHKFLLANLRRLQSRQGGLSRVFSFSF